MNIAYISCHDYWKHSVGYFDEESYLLEFLRQQGLHIERQVWNDGQVNWKSYDLILLKSPWDYHERKDDFLKWLNTLQQLHVPLLNPGSLVRWNSDKSYLADIGKVGSPVIPTILLDRGSHADLPALFEQLRAEKIVIKPCVSAGAKNVITVTRESIDDRKEMIGNLFGTERYVAQPFMKEIHDGEWSLIFFNGQFSHSVLKVPAKDDFRVQQYHGGKITAIDADPKHIGQAAAVVAHFAKDALYARVDGVIRDGGFWLMELELIEPYLYLNTNSNACGRYYEALIQAMKHTKY